MKNLIAIQNLVSSLSKKGRKDLKNYTEIHHKDCLTSILIHHILAKKGKPISNEDVFQILYPNQNINLIKLTQLISRTKVILEQFIVIQNSPDLVKKTKLLFALHDLKQEKWKESKLNSLYKTSDLSNFSGGFAISLFEQRLRTISLLTSEIKYSESRVNLQGVIYALDDLYLLEKLKLVCTAIVVDKIYPFGYQFGLFHQFNEYLENSIDESKPLLYLYYNAYKMHHTQNRVYFEKIYSYLKTHKINQNPDYANLLYFLLNFCNALAYQGNRKIYSIYLDVYRILLDSGNIYHHEKTILSMDYRNIVSIALLLKKFDWVLNFMESYKKYLPENERESSYNYSKGLYYFEVQNYTECIQILMKVSLKNKGYNLMINTILSKAYYELNDFVRVDQIIQNMRFAILRSKSPRNKIYSNYFKVLNLLIKYDGTDKSLKNLKSMFESTHPITTRPWLSKKIAMLTIQGR